MAAAKKSVGKKAKKRSATTVRKAPKKASVKKPAVKKNAAPKKAPARSAAKKKPAKAPATRPVTRTARSAASIPRKASSAGKLARSLSAKDKAQLQEALMDLRERLTGQVAALRDDSLRREDRVNIEEDGSDAFDRQLALKLASTEQDSLYAIDEALQQLMEGTYGVCIECGCRIEKARLQALPFVSTCISCQSQLEKTGLARKNTL